MGEPGTRNLELGTRNTEPGSRNPVELTPDLLRRWPLPQPEEGGDKEERGRVLVVGGTAELPGAVVLAATAALRAGAGKLRIATVRSVAAQVAVAVPEARVYSLPESETGMISAAAAAQIAGYACQVQAVLLGPGMVDEETTGTFLGSVLQQIEGPVVVLDAAALACLTIEPECLHRFGGRGILTPHAGEMARMLQVERNRVKEDPVGTARRTAAAFRAVVALKGAETIIAGPDGAAYRNRAGNVGLATSGSGDTLAGIIAGLAARGADPLQAAAWGVYLHASAGERLAERIGPLGFLARELLAEVPRLMGELSRSSSG